MEYTITDLYILLESQLLPVLQNACILVIAALLTLSGFYKIIKSIF